MKVLVTGAAGQLGWELQRTVPAGVSILALDRVALDITDTSAVAAFFQRERPDAVINAAAYTAVDRAEQEVDRAYAGNALAPKYLAVESARIGAHLVQLSTDFVFGTGTGRACRTDDPTAPSGVYAASKLEGERAVIAAGGRSLILRTAWVYSAHGNNFVKTMLKLMRERESLRVVADQIGTPTWARGLAEACWRAVEIKLTGVHHWTDAGAASWYDFAVAIGEEGAALGLLPKTIPVTPIATADYPTPAARPPFSVLDKQATWIALGRSAPHWRAQLRGMLQELKDHPHA